MEEKKIIPRKIKLSKDFFINKDRGGGDMRVVESVSFVFDRIQPGTEWGILTHFKGCKYPKTAFPYDEAVDAIDLVKKYTMAFVMTLSMKELLLPMLAFLFLRRKTKIKIIERALSRYAILGDYVLDAHYLELQHRTKISKAIRQFVTVFLQHLGISKHVSERVAEIFSTLVEYDDAYRYRLQDLFTMISKNQLMINPRQTVDYLMRLIKERDREVSHKFMAFGKIAKIALYLPSVKSALREALKDLPFEDLQFNDFDRYHATLRDGYNFFGMTNEQRISMWYEMHPEGVPDQQIITI